MQRCVLMILFAFCLLLETCSACHYSYNASFLKTCEFCFKFISEHGITGGINRKLAKATASANAYLHPTTTRKPIVYERRASAQVGSGTTEKAESGKNSVWVKSSSRAGMSGYKAGAHWNSLEAVNTEQAKQKIGKINKSAFGGGEIRTDGTYIYRFDNGHKTGKIHVEKYKRIKDNVWQPYAECDPVTGDVLCNSMKKMAKRPPIKW